MGLTGIILSATIQLIPILSSLITQKTIKADCIEAASEGRLETKVLPTALHGLIVLQRKKSQGAAF